jgi:hypothetical protein
MMIEEPANNGDTPVRRSDLLTLLCILSFVGSGIAAFSNLVLLITYDQMDQVLQDFNFEMEAMNLLLSGGKSFFLAGFVLYMVSLTGVLAMWRLKKIGFHLYTAAQLFLLILPVVMIPNFPFSVAGMLVTAVFVFGYATQLKLMKR